MTCSHGSPKPVQKSHCERPQGAWQSSTYTIKRLNSAVLFFLDGHAKPALCVAIRLSEPCNIRLTDLQISTEAMPAQQTHKFSYKYVNLGSDENRCLMPKGLYRFNFLTLNLNYFCYIFAQCKIKRILLLKILKAKLERSSVYKV